MNVQPMEDIEKQYDKQWVLMDELVQKPSLEVTAARVLFASPDRNAVHDQAKKSAAKHIAVFYMGKLFDDEMVYVL